MANQRVFIRDANGKIQGNPKGYATMNGAKRVFNGHAMQVFLIDIGNEKMAAYLKICPTYGGANLVEIGSYGFENVL